MAFKILHTADWHLGKIFCERPLLEDQRDFLNQILAELERESERGEPYDALVVSGDIYDTANPSAEAMSLLDTFYADATRKFPGLHLFLSRGNHDSARIGFNRAFLDGHGIHLCSGTEKFFEPSAVICKEGEELAVYQLPYLNQQSAIPFDGDSQPRMRSQEELVGRACSEIARFHKENFPGAASLLSAHLTTFGSLKSAYDESSVGAIEEVSADNFSPFDYTALGHIHKFQKCGSKSAACYSGSPLAYYFDSSPETFMLRVEVERGIAPSVTPVPFVPLHKVERLCGLSEEFISADKEFVSAHKDSYIEFIYEDEVLPVNAIASLRAIYPLALSFKQKERAAREGGGNSSLGSRESTFGSPEKYFDAFCSDVLGTEIADEALHKKARALFIEIARKYEGVSKEGEE